MVYYPLKSPLPSFFLRGISPIALTTLYCALAVALMTLDYKLKYLESVRSTIHAVVEPFNKIMRMPALLWQRSEIWLQDSQTLHKELVLLREQNKADKLALLLHQKLLAENYRLRKLLSLDAPPGLKGIRSEVIFEARSPYVRRVVLNKGTRDSVTLGQPVIGPNGLLGQIIRVFYSASEVQLLTNPNSIVAVTNGRTKYPLLLRGQGSDTLELQYIQSGVDIREGDTLFTYGLDGIYPKGIPVARITLVNHGGANDFVRAISLPTAEAQVFSEALILERTELPFLQAILPPTEKTQ